MVDRYYEAQMAITKLKAAVLDLLKAYPDGLRNVDIGKMLGIYMGHVEHKGHIPRTILQLLEKDGVARQDVDNEKRWFAVFDK